MVTVLYRRRPDPVTFHEYGKSYRSEWLDADLGTPEEIDSALHSVSLANRRFGGVRLHARLLGRAIIRVSRRPPAHILEVASGRADVLQAALLRLGGAGPESPRMSRCWTAAAFTCPIRGVAGRAAPAAGGGGRRPRPSVPRLKRGYRLLLSLSASSRTAAGRTLLAEAQRVARVAVIVNDLERSPVHYRLAQLNRLIDRSRISRHDGPVSVRRAYTRNELAEMLTKTGGRFLLERAWLYRLGAILWCGSCFN